MEPDEGGEAMAIETDGLLSDLTVEALIARLEASSNPSEIELIADQLRAAGDHRAIRPLLAHLGDDPVQADPNVEDAVCRALMALGVMSSSGRFKFSLRPREVLQDDAIEAIRDAAGTIPWRYFGTARN